MKKFKKIMTLVLAAIFIVIASVNVFAAVETTNTGKYSEPIPLLVIKISFDADGSGTDARMQDGKIDVKDSSSVRFGEQWCYSDDSWWYEQLFSDNYYSLKNYYKYISNNQFWWEPVEETYGTVNDGVVYVILPNVKHPNSTMGDTTSGPELGVAVKAADEYVDYSKYDKNGDGVITYDELTILFVYGGMEASIGQGNTSQYAFNTHAHVSQSSANISLDGVKVLNGPYVRVGEAISTAGKFLGYGTIAHELGHVLGAKDLYLSDGAEWWGSPGPASLMGSGSKGRAGGNLGSYVGSAPSSLDPYYSVEYGFADLMIADSAQTEYTLYSHATGKYSALRINTPNPNEYYLIENRSYSEEAYDNNTLQGDLNGIVVWHINELAMQNYVRPNNGGEGHDIGITVLTPDGSLSGEASVAAFKASGDSTFDSSEYKFHTTGTWYMLLTKEQAADYNIKINVLSDAGDEMKISIEGIYDMPVQYRVTEYNLSDSTLGLKAIISAYNNNEVESCTVTISKNADMSDSVTKTAELLEDGSYGAMFENVEADTKYYYTFEMVGTKNTGIVRDVTYTLAEQKAATYYTISVYKNLKENESAYKVKVNLGEKFTYTFPMSKSGYAFCGWYLDAEFTQKYDMNFTQDEAKDFTLYAKWVPADEVATLKIVNATATNKIFSVNVGETFVTPEYAEKDGYEFEGWYADSEYTTPFDFSAPVTSTGTVTVYAKWKNLNPETTTEPVQTQTTPEAEQTTAPDATDPVDNDNNGGATTVIIIVVVAVVVIAGAAVAAVVISKKKKQ